jgi:hypothetical protein
LATSIVTQRAEESYKKALALREEGNAFFKQQEYQKALGCYHHVCTLAGGQDSLAVQRQRANVTSGFSLGVLSHHQIFLLVNGIDKSFISSVNANAGANVSDQMKSDVGNLQLLVNGNMAGASSSYNAIDVNESFVKADALCPSSPYSHAPMPLCRPDHPPAQCAAVCILTIDL